MITNFELLILQERTASAAAYRAPCAPAHRPEASVEVVGATAHMLVLAHRCLVSALASSVSSTWF